MHWIIHSNNEHDGRKSIFMSQKRDKGYSQKGRPNAETGKRLISAEELELAIHPTKRQNPTVIFVFLTILSGFFSRIILRLFHVFNDKLPLFRFSSSPTNG